MLLTEYAAFTGTQPTIIYRCNGYMIAVETPIQHLPLALIGFRGHDCVEAEIVVDATSHNPDTPTAVCPKCDQTGCPHCAYLGYIPLDWQNILLVFTATRQTLTVNTIPYRLNDAGHPIMGTPEPLPEPTGGLHQTIADRLQSPVENIETRWLMAAWEAQGYGRRIC